MWRQGLALFVFCFTLTAQASESFNFSTENYHWSEYASDGSRYLTESGRRSSLGLSSTHYQGYKATYSNIRYYFGDVHYDGYLQDINQNLTPFQSTTGYSGFSMEQKHLSYAFANMRGYGEFGYGMDMWQRLLDKGGSNGYTETYLTLYLRAGLGMGHRDAGWYGSLGVKYPLLVSETVQSYPYDTIRLSPTPQFSSYAEAGYAAHGWGLALFYDSYNFGASSWVPVTYGGYGVGLAARQPKSVTDRLGLRISISY